MNSTEAALKERIKELTCLYKVSSIISIANSQNISNTLSAIASCLKKAFQFPDCIEVLIDTQYTNTQVLTKIDTPSICSDILVFNVKKGGILARYKEGTPHKKAFLKEEQRLINNVALKIGDFLERIEIKNNERALRRQMERADRLATLGELTAGIAHELNTPLASILGFSELLKSRLASDKESVADLDKIISSAIFSREVVKKLMFFACDNEEDIMLRADSVQLTQIIFNLLMNAIYFSPKNGLVKIWASQNQREVFIKISDEGKGLSDETLEKVFQPFYSTKPVGEGSGLGLSVVHGIVMSHKGSIIAENNSHKGATFTVRLPKN